jgi:hypothetical protein
MVGAVDQTALVAKSQPEDFRRLDDRPIRFAIAAGRGRETSILSGAAIAILEQIRRRLPIVHTFASDARNIPRTFRKNLPLRLIDFASAR